MRRSVQLGASFFGRLLSRHSKKIGLAAIPVVFVAQRWAFHTASATTHSQNEITPREEANGNITLCRIDDLKEGDLRTFKVSGKAILLAKIEGEIYSCDAVSPVDGKTLFDESLLIGDKIYDIVNGAIFSIKDGTPEYSPNLNSLKRHRVILEENGTVSVRILKEKQGFDTINMIGWVPDFAAVTILGSGIEGLSIARTLRHAKFRGFITLMFGEEISTPYDRNLLFEDLANLDAKPVKDQEFYDTHQIKIAKNKEEVKYLNIDKRIILTTPGTEEPVQFQKLVYALGNKPCFHAIAGLGLAGVFSPISFSDFKKIKAEKDSFKKIIVVGDSLNSIRLVNNLKKNTNAEITLITESDGILSSMKLGDEVHQTLAAELQARGIKIINHLPITGAFGNKKVEKISLVGGKELMCDSLFLMREEFPNVDSCETNMRLCADGGLYTDPFQRTVSQNIQAIGSTASIIVPFIGERGRYNSTGDSLVQAHNAALNILEKRVAIRTIPFDYLNLSGVRLNIVGFPKESTHSVVEGDTDKKDYIIYYFRKDQLVGASTPNRFKDLAIIRESLLQDIVPRGQFNINTNDLLASIKQLKMSKLHSTFLNDMRKRTHIVK